MATPHDPVMNPHSRQGTPACSRSRDSKALRAVETPLLMQRGSEHPIGGGVFERFPAAS